MMPQMEMLRIIVKFSDEILELNKVKELKTTMILIYEKIIFNYTHQQTNKENLLFCSPSSLFVVLYDNEVYVEEPCFLVTVTDELDNFCSFI